MNEVMEAGKKHSEIISEFGGTGALAKLCEVSSQAVSGWKKKGIPKGRIKYLKLVKPSAFNATPNK